MPRNFASLALLLALGAPAAGRGAVALLAADGGGGSTPVTVTLLGNEGVWIAGGGRSVLVDALFGDGLPGYAAVEPRRRADLEAARGEFAEVDLVLATHAHRDHFDASAVARHLTANSRARFVSTPEAVAALRALPEGVGLSSRLHAALPSEGSRETVRHSGVSVTIVQLHHGRDLRQPVTHLGFLVEIAGRRIAHLGDTEASADEIAASGLATGGIDLALIPYWRLLAPAGRAELRAVLRPARVAAIHVPAPGAAEEMYGVAGGASGLDRALGRPESGVERLDGGTRRIDLTATAKGR